jgi:hypothetical protein
LVLGVCKTFKIKEPPVFRTLSGRGSQRTRKEPFKTSSSDIDITLFLKCCNRRILWMEYNNLFVNKAVEMFKLFALSIMDVPIFKMKLTSNIVITKGVLYIK